MRAVVCHARTIRCYENCWMWLLKKAGRGKNHRITRVWLEFSCPLSCLSWVVWSNSLYTDVELEISRWKNNFDWTSICNGRTCYVPTADNIEKRLAQIRTIRTTARVPIIHSTLGSDLLTDRKSDRRRHTRHIILYCGIVAAVPRDGWLTIWNSIIVR